MKRLFIALTTALCFLLLAYAVPSFVRWRVRATLAKYYPDVKAERIEPDWKVVNLYNVSFERSWVYGTLDLVTIPMWGDDGEVLVTGGHISADLNKRKDTPSNGSKRKIAGRYIMGEVTRGDATASFTDLGFSSDGVGAPDVVINHPKIGRVVTTNVSYAHADHIVRIGTAVVRDAEFAGHAFGDVTLGDIQIDLQNEEVSVGKASLPKYRVEAHSLGVARGGGGDYLVHVGEFQVQNERLASTPITFLSFDLDVFPDIKLVRLNKDGVTIATISESRALLFLMGDAPCSTWLDLLPQELRVPAIDELYSHFTGQFSFELNLRPKVSFNYKSSCKSTCDLPVFKALRKEFTYSTLGADGSPRMLKAGPSDHLNWTPLAGVSRHMVTALTILEDPGFFTHHGFIRQAIENSIRDDLKADRFLRGGSTLTMQLSKNLWLSSEKTLGRKAQEAFLTMGLEGCLSKDEILTLYLNVVEFGRGLYGITPAAMHYFKVAPSDLTPEQAFYLVSILPHPRTAPPPTEATMTRIKSMMSRFAEEGRIPDLLGTEGTADPSGWEPSP